MFRLSESSELLDFRHACVVPIIKLKLQEKCVLRQRVQFQKSLDKGFNGILINGRELC